MTLALTSAAAWVCTSGLAKDSPSMRFSQYTLLSVGTPVFS